MEFYGSGSSTFKPFEALKVLKFRDMPDWKNWLCFDSENEGEAFPRLEELYILKCPELTGGLPIHLPSLAKLEIVECLQLEASLPRSPTLHQMMLTNFNEVLLNELPSGLLQKVVLKGCVALRSLPEGMMGSSSPLQELEIDGCCSLMLLSDDGLPSTLETLKISNCKKLEFPVHFNYSSLKQLYLGNSCDSLKCFPVNLIVEIDIFTIYGFENLESLTDSEQHESDSAASIIRIENCPNFVSFPDGGLRAQKLKTFEINGCGSLRSLPNKMHLLLPSLKSLFISECPMLQSFGEGDLPTNLKSISIKHCDKLVASRTTWGLQKLSSLQELYIHGKCKDMESFPEPASVPITITSLTISGFSNMTSLDNLGLQHLTSLESMWIYDCPNLKFLPKDGFLVSISLLDISKCPLLEKLLQNKKGKEWRKVAHISHIRITYKTI
ncbi:putative disease resistance protein At3g14460 [Juglans microcarpa x Juglans regia]|uniref:putative disease resistance protein At3g14460 n=1 Tax=Juglans microcarpa x Juglans regia TaxID=2249226 RepID=UPI001B7DF67F|nr:putative disease resistance protein At3g14460 [Juglans microcarpa x Juglans regia]